MENRLARQLLKVYREHEQFRSAPLTPAKPDFSGRNAGSWFEADYQSCGHAAPLLDSYEPYTHSIGRRGEISPLSLGIIQVDLIRAKLAENSIPASIDSARFFRALSLSLEGWDEKNVVQEYLEKHELETRLDRVQARKNAFWTKKRALIESRLSSKS